MSESGWEREGGDDVGGDGDVPEDPFVGADEGGPAGDLEDLDSDDDADDEQ
jgi:hypothetical protein